MRRRNLGIQKQPEIMIIPMIDIVFFLLIFFMVSSLYMNTDSQIPLSLPKASSSTAKVIEPVTISLTADKKIYVNNELTSADDVGARIKAYVASDKSRPFIIRAEKNLVYNDVVAMLDELKENGATYVSVATERK